jgi:hypothetical protein
MSRQSEAILNENHTGFSTAKFLSSARIAVGPANPEEAPTFNNNLLVESLRTPRTDEFGHPVMTQRITYAPLRRLKFFLIDEEF